MSKILKTVITLTILHREEDAIENLDLYEIASEMDEGCFVGSAVQIGESVNLQPDQVRSELIAIGNDGTFFEDLFEDDGNSREKQLQFDDNNFNDEHDLSSYSAWLEDTGNDDSFKGDAENGIPSTEDIYEEACSRACITPDWS